MPKHIVLKLVHILFPFLVHYKFGLTHWTYLNGDTISSFCIKAAFMEQSSGVMDRHNRWLKHYYHIAFQGHDKQCHEEVNPQRKIVWLTDTATASEKSRVVAALTGKLQCNGQNTQGGRKAAGWFRVQAGLSVLSFKGWHIPTTGTAGDASHEAHQVGCNWTTAWHWL